ncbi:hypothetical protein ES707_15612 [subsurface metagenome]
MVEILDGVLQFLEHVLLPLAVAGDVGNRPHRIFRHALDAAERPHAHAQPAALPAIASCNAHLFLLALAFARGLEQAEHGLGDIGIADEDAFDRADVLPAGCAGQRKIRRVGIDHMTARIGDREAIIGKVGDAANDRVVGIAVGETDDPGGKGEQVEQPDHRQHRQHAEDIGLSVDTAERHQGHGNPHQGGSHQQHQNDAAAARRLMDGNRLGRQFVVRLGGHIKRHR